MAKYPNHTPEQTLDRQVEKAHAFKLRVQAAGKRLLMPPKRQSRFNALMGFDSTCTSEMLLSDVVLRNKAASTLFRAVRVQLPNLASDGTPMFHVTFADDMGLTSDLNPTLKFAAMKRKVDKAIRAMNMSAIVMIEIQPLLNEKFDGEGRTLMVHAHALCWGPVSRRAFRNAVKKLNESRSWSNTFGAKPIVTRRLNNGLDDALKIVAYVAKLPHDAKYKKPVYTSSGPRYQFRPTIKGYRDSLALRIAEGLSHYTIFDAVFGVGDGKFIRKVWKSELVEWHHQRLVTSARVDSFNIAAFWKRVHRKHGNGRYAPYNIE